MAQHTKTSCLILRCLLCIFSIWATFETHAGSAFNIITLQHRLAEELLPVIRPLVGNDGTASAMQNNLIIRTSPEKMQQIEQMISVLDTARQMLKVTVSRGELRHEQKSGIEVSGRTYHNETVNASGSQQHRMKEGLAVDITEQKTTKNLHNTQFIRVLDGEQAFIRVGQSIPYSQQWRTYTQRYASTQQITAFVSIDTGFSVRPTIIGNEVALEITPRFAALGPSALGQSQDINFASLATTIRIPPGGWVSLTGTMQQKDDVSRAILNFQNIQEVSDIQLLVKVDKEN